MLDLDLVQKYCARFLGYGTFHAHVWFVGIEEGGGTDCNSVAGRLRGWRDLGCPEVADVRRMHQTFGVTKFWSGERGEPRAEIQRTWARLIRIHQYIYTREWLNTCEVRNYQDRHFGCTADSRERREATCILELFPLPKPNENAFPYSKWISPCPAWAQSLDEYREHWTCRRTKLLHGLISQHSPRIVIGYGCRVRHALQPLCGPAANCLPPLPAGAVAGRIGQTHVLLMPFPRLMSTEACQSVARAAATALQLVR